MNEKATTEQIAEAQSLLMNHFDTGSNEICVENDAAVKQDVGGWPGTWVQAWIKID